MTRRDVQSVLTVPFLFVLAACSGDGPTPADDPSPPSAGETALLSVAPEGGSTGVGVDTVITVEFSHSVDPAMSEYAVVHAGAVAGPEVPGTWKWLDHETVLRFTPDDLLAPATE
jgi:hypothetical protein